ncbi:MAG TPA: Ig-like domain-containing protein, partial [Candidatus Methylomirabilis sp.]|nr:Ig-like domain-containing protein [Candidatus Methylomirabilis sp.]
ATLQNGSTFNVTNLATWTSSNPGAATIVSAGLVKGTATGGTTLITATYNGVSSNFTLSVNKVSVNSLTVTPIAATMPVGVTQRFSATAVFSDTTSQDITADATWTSGTPSVATINTPGVALSLTAGNTNITAAFGGVTSPAAALTVDSSTLTSIAVSPGSTVLPVGKAINYNAYGTYSDGLSPFVITNLAVWTSSDTSLVSINSVGLAQTLKPGPPVTITAAYQGKASNATVIVTQFPLVSITVPPPTLATVPVGVSTQFTAMGTFSDQSTQSLTSYATWAANPSSVATINTGLTLPGSATGLSPGQATVTAVFAGVVSNKADLTVSAATIQSITVTPNPASAAHGSQLQFKAVGHFNGSSDIDLTNQVTWSSSSATVATMNGGGTASIAGTSGQTAQITATFTQNGVPVSGTSTLTVQ